MRIVYTYRETERVFDREASEIVIGRPKEGVLVDLDLSPDTKVSRPHARVWLNGFDIWIEDLGSAAGTVVGDRILHAKAKLQLKIGDVVRLGETLLRIEMSEASNNHIAPKDSVPFSPGTSIHTTTVSEAVLRPFSGMETITPGERQLGLLYELPLQFGAEASLEGLLQKIVARLIQIVPRASRAALLLKDRGTGELILKAHLPHGAPTVSLTSARRAMENNEGFVWVPDIDSSRSQIRHLVCASIYAPMIWEGQSVGVVCVDSSDPRCQFSKDDLHLLITVAQYAAMAVEHHRLREDLRRQTELTNMLFSSRFPPHVRADLIREASDGTLVIGTRQSQVTVLASDIRGFTQLTARLGPQRMRDLLNEYFPPLIDAIHEFGGTIERFVGDAIFAVFGSPQLDDRQHEHALRAAWKMQQLVGRHNASRAARGAEICEIGIGIHCGEALNGFIGNAERMEFAVLGEPANFAGRFCSGAGGGEILLSPELHARIFHLVDCQAVVIPTKHEGDLPAYRVKGFFE